MQPRFETLAGVTVDARATPFESFASLDPALRKYLGTPEAAAFDARVRSYYGSDAFFLPIGKLDAQDVDATLEYLGVKRYGRDVCAFDAPWDMEMVLYSVPTWPGYYVTCRSQGDDPRELFVFKLMK